MPEGSAMKLLFDVVTSNTAEFVYLPYLVLIICTGGINKRLYRMIIYLDSRLARAGHITRINDT